MKALSEITDELCTWYARQMVSLSEIDLLDQCELFLCASDLGLNTPAIQKNLAALLQTEEGLTPKDRPVLHSIVLLLVFARFAVGLEQRRNFLTYWFEAGRFRKQGLFIAGSLVNLALQNQELLNPQALAEAQQWYLHCGDLKSDKLAAWAPFCLKLAGYPTEAEAKALEAMNRREKNGSWGNDVRRSIACAYALALSALVSRDHLDKTINYLASRYQQGIIAGLPFRAQTLRLFQMLGLVPPGSLKLLQDLLTQPPIVFLSYSRIDLEAADNISDNLGKLGFETWLDRTAIGPGEEWPERLVTGITGADVILLLLSKNFLKSAYCLKEILFALKKEKPLLAVHLDRAMLPDKIELMLGDTQRLYLLDYPDFASFLREVETGLRRLTPEKINHQGHQEN